MACCAFAVFLLGQIAMGFDRVRVFVFGERAENLRPNLSVAWSPAATAALQAPSRPDFANGLKRAFSPRMIALAVSLELMLAVGGFVGLAAQAGYSASDLTAALAVICSGGQLTTL